MSMELSVQGKNAIVTGAAGNIGEACVRALAAAGANVLVADMDAAAAERTVEKLQKDNGQTPTAGDSEDKSDSTPL